MLLGYLILGALGVGLFIPRTVQTNVSVRRGIIRDISIYKERYIIFLVCTFKNGRCRKGAPKD